LTNRIRSRVWDWLDDRANLKRLKHEALEEPLPRKVGWAHTLGSGAMFLFGLQVITGIVLAMNYSPSPDHAWDSIQYIMQQTGGTALRGLHHYGASAMFVVVCLHMLRVFVYGAYKRPRELTWMVGVILFSLVLGFSFTGYLLPFDQKAYWATKVGAEFAGYVPLLGPALKRILLGGDSVGAPTLSRFFIIHVVVLPMLLAPLIGVHILLMRRKGEMPPWTEAADEALVPKPITFYPFQAFKDSVFCALLLTLLLTLTFTLGVHTEPKADPTAPYVPRPEWYFLPLFQLEKLRLGDFFLFGGPRVWIGTVLVPNLFLLFLMLLPFIDRNPSRLPRNRKLALTGAALFLLFTIGLGVKAKTDSDAEWHKLAKGKPASEFTGAALVGERVFRSKCASCHRLGTSGRKQIGPDLIRLVGAHKSAWRKEDLVFFLINPKLTYPDTVMPPAKKLGLSMQDLDAMAAFCLNFEFAKARPLAKAKASAASASATPVVIGAPAAMGPGFGTFIKECVKCHKFNGVGGKPGMPEFISGRSPRSRPWLISLLKSPTSVFPDTIMPPAEARGAAFEQLVDFLMTVKVGRFDPKTMGGGIDAVLAKRVTELEQENKKLKAELAKSKGPVAASLPELPPLAPEVLTKALGVFGGKCNRCHQVEGVAGLLGGGVLGPKLVKGRSPRTKEEMTMIIEDPITMLGSGTIMPPTKLPDDTERDALIEFMLRLKPVPK